MLFYTLNTGHTVVSPRSEVPDAAVQQVSSLLRRGLSNCRQAGPLAGYEVDITTPNDFLLATVYQNKRPLIAFAVAPNEKAAENWIILEQLYALSPHTKTEPAIRPQSVPWLAVVFFRFTREEAMWLSSFERALAWAWIEKVTVQTQAQPDQKRLADHMLQQMQWEKKQSEARQNQGSGRVPERKVRVPLHPGAEPLPGYRLIQRLGNGAFGEVWSAQSSDKRVAIKFAFDLAHSKLETEGLMQISRVLHPLVINIYKYDFQAQTPIIVTELADTSLEDHAKVCRATASGFRWCAELIFLLRDAAEALDFVQAKYDLLHLDIKPANLLLVSGRCKIGDFGTVRHIPPQHPSVALCAPSTPTPEEITAEHFSRHEDVAGGNAECRRATLFTAHGVFCPYFAPPERFQGKLSRSIDQYSLALTFCELLAGITPFSENGHARLKEQVAGTMKLEFLPEVLRPLIAKALSPQPEDRFSSCSEFVTSLRHAFSPWVLSDPIADNWLTGWSVKEVRRLIDLGIAYCTLGKWDQAVAHFTEAISIDPQDGEAHYRRGAAYNHLGNHDRAIEDCTEAILLNPLLGEAHLHRAVGYNNLGNYAKAIEDCTEAIRLNPQLTEAHYQRACAYHSAGPCDRAIEGFSETIRLDPQRYDAYVLRAIDYNDLQNYEQVVTDCTHAIQLNPQSGGAYKLRGSAFKHLGNYERAIEDITEASRLNPRISDYAQVVEDCTLAIHFKPQLAGAYRLRGAAYNHLCNYERAIEDCTEAIRLNPKLSEAHFHRGVAHKGIDNLARAIEDFSQTVQLDPQHFEAYSMRGAIYLRIGNYRQAIEDCSHSIRICPGYEMAYVLRGGALYWTNKFDLAIDDFTQAIRLNPQFGVAYGKRGAAYIAIGKHDRAIEDCTQAIKLDPEYSQAYSDRGAAYTCIGQHERAIEDGTQAIRLDPVNWMAYFVRGRAYAEMGDMARYEEQFAIGNRLHKELQVARATEPSAGESMGEVRRDYEEINQTKQVNDEQAEAGRRLVFGEHANHERFIEACTQAIRLNPKDSLTYCHRGAAYSDLGKYDQAIDDFTEAIRLNPAFDEPYQRRGYAYNHLGKFDQAIEDLTKAIQGLPENGMAYRERGVALAATGKYHLAIKDLTQAIQLKPEDHAGYYWRAFSYNRVQSYERTVEDCTEAIRLNHVDKAMLSQSFCMRAAIYVRREKFAIAIEDYTQAIGLTPEIGWLYFVRGRAYELAGNMNRAKEDFARANHLQAGQT